MQDVDRDVSERLQEAICRISVNNFSKLLNGKNSDIHL